jgi:hypothetical protein
VMGHHPTARPRQQRLEADDFSAHPRGFGRSVGVPARPIRSWTRPVWFGVRPEPTQENSTDFRTKVYQPPEEGPHEAPPNMMGYGYPCALEHLHSLLALSSARSGPKSYFSRIKILLS